tara:strand:+ start:1112 stop:1603 length:492 start_codon:yes stop_codon:yes gene_type:complete
MIGQLITQGIPAAASYIGNKFGSFFNDAASAYARSGMTTPYGKVPTNYQMFPTNYRMYSGYGGLGLPSRMPSSISGFGDPGYFISAGRPGDAADIEVLRRVLNEKQFQEHMSNLPEYNPNSEFDLGRFQKYMSQFQNEEPRFASRQDYDQPQITDIDIFGTLL